ncbi:MAG: Gfo/Idh/MocA family oxidoreductase [Anaerolineales bacterium]|nr:Gfo/Idh/MocA family oxidoreductase [Anaerolineales bacterium]
MNILRWGVLGASHFACEKVLPAMQSCQHAQVIAIASRSMERSQQVTERFGIEKSYADYEELLADPQVEAVYIPLPNALHVAWSKRALQAGKHVLCEKPLGLNANEAEGLLAEAHRHPHLAVMEAFMYRFHPQWQRAKRSVEEGEIGELRAVHTTFTYYNVDPNNIRNRAEVGGGALLDVGCYPISLSRFLFDREPVRVSGSMELDPQFGTDRLTASLLEFDDGAATFLVSTQLAPYQRVSIFGTQGRLEIEMPFNPAPYQPTRLWLQRGVAVEEILIDPCNQYTLQADAFSAAVLAGKPAPIPLEDAVANMQAIDALAQAARLASNA